MYTLNDFVKLAVSILVPVSAGFLGSLYTAPAIDGWYSSLIMPVLSPPSWVFAPVWTTLYIMMGVALFLVWRKGFSVSAVRIGVFWFGVQLAFNALWSYLFFGLQSPGAALVDILFLVSTILVTIYAFSRVSKLAAWLLVPYLGWVCFATYLNYMIWIINM